MKKEPLLFKIWDKRNNQYISGNGKTHWRSMKWIKSKLRDLCASNWSKRDVSDFEIQTFELQLIDTQPARPLLIEGTKERRDKEINQEIAERCKENLRQLFPTINVPQIRSLYNDGLVNSRSMKLLKPIIELLVEAERNS